jgi:hypothetical protein
MAMFSALGRTTGWLEARLDLLRRLRGPGVEDFTARVKELVVIASSSRGGSSMLAELLRSSNRLLHLRAEFNPFLRLVHLDFPHSGSDSDRLDERHARSLGPDARRVLDCELSLDAGTAQEAVEDDDRFLLDAAWRFTIQWPELELDLGMWGDAARAALARARRPGGGAGSWRVDPALFQRELLCRLRGAGVAVDPWRYDLPRAMLEAAFPAERPGGPPRGPLVEEPPFVCPRPWRRASADQLDGMALVVKTPSNAHRIPFLRALFPNARVRLIHLTRNPAAAINGLFDGWRHNAFQSHRMSEPLQLAGYGERNPADRWWWKFDLPPAWRHWRRASLLEVCAFQWRSSHEAILSAVARGGVECVRVRSEDLTRGPSSCMAELERLSDWLGIPFDGPLRGAAQGGIEPVAATEPPRPSRWRARAGAVQAVLDPAVLAMAEELDYGDQAEWI